MEETTLTTEQLIRHQFNGWTPQMHSTKLTTMASSWECPPEVLSEILLQWKFDEFELNMSNPIFFSAIKNPNCPKETLLHVWNLVKDSPENRMGYGILVNEKCPREIMEQAFDRPFTDSSNLQMVANPSFPPDLLARVVDEWDGKRYTRPMEYIGRNNRNPELLKKILKKADVNSDTLISNAVIRNDACPVKQQVEFKIRYGKDSIGHTEYTQYLFEKYVTCLEGTQ